MKIWQQFRAKPAELCLRNWFASLAAALLNRGRLIVCGQPHRLTEIEFYYHTADHPDPYSHRHPQQLSWGQWYFHRTGNSFRGGSFKGLDLTFGGKKAYGGILLRTLETPDGKSIHGPSLVVDYLLARCEAANVADLAQALENRPATDTKSVLRLQFAATGDTPLETAARVGLSFKRVPAIAENLRFLLAPYRFLSDPKRIAKGKVHLVLALACQGLDEDAIHERTGCPRHAIRRYLEECDRGSTENRLQSYGGKSFAARDLCRLHAFAAAHE